MPHNSELYVHRGGRTARAKREGLSVILIGPEDMTSYLNICKTLNRGVTIYSIIQYLLFSIAISIFMYTVVMCMLVIVALPIVMGAWSMAFLLRQ